MIQPAALRLSRRALPALSLCALMVPLSGCVARGANRISNVDPLSLQEGANLVPHLAPDGRQGLIVEGRQPIGDSSLIMTMLPRAEGRRGWDVVAMPAQAGGTAPTLDTRERAVVFARAKVSGMPATLLFVIEADPADPVPLGSARRMVIHTMRLQTAENGAGFEEIATQTTRTRYCSGLDALAVGYRLALPDDGGRSDRCRAGT